MVQGSDDRPALLPWPRKMDRLPGVCDIGAGFAAPAELEDIQFVDIYKGKGITPGSKSVTLSLRFRDEDGTLTHDVVDGYQAAILEGLRTGVGAELRTF